MDALNPYRLRIFAAVVEHGSFRLAAEHLHLTQPAVSAQVRYLREFAGAPILVRDGRRVVVTEAGRSLYRYALQALGAAEALERDLREIVSGERDHIVVGGGLAYGTYVLPALLAEFQQRHPGVRLSLFSSWVSEVVDRVREGRVDVGLVTSGIVSREHANDMVVARVCQDELVLIEAASRPFSRGEPMSLAEVATCPFVGVGGEFPPEAALNRLLSAEGLNPVRSMIELGTWEGTKDAVKTGIGLAVVFRSVVQHDIDNGQLGLVEAEGFKQAIGVELIRSPHRRDTPQSTVFEQFLDFLRAEVPPVLRPDAERLGSAAAIPAR